mgnify:CR=1 FL=1
MRELVLRDGLALFPTLVPRPAPENVGLALPLARSIPRICALMPSLKELQQKIELLQPRFSQLKESL